MKLYDLIEEMSKSKEWYNKYYSSGNISSVLFFGMFSTNIRTTEAFIEQINRISLDIDKERSEWTKNIKTGQEVSKQYVMPLLSNQYIQRNENNNFEFTEKKNVILDLEYQKFSKFSTRLVLNLFTLNYNMNKRGLLFEEYSRFISNLSKVGISKDELKRMCNEVYQESDVDAIYRNKLLLLIIFYNDYSETQSNMLSIIANMSDIEISEYYNRVKYELKSKSEYSLLSNRLKSGGNLTKATVINIIELIELCIYVDSVSGDYESVIPLILSNYSTRINKDEISKYLLSSEVKNVMQKILFDIGINLTQSKHINLDNLDVSTYSGSINSDQIFENLKTPVFEFYNYSCAFEELRNCSKNYFTSRSTGKTYLEVHHFLPRKYKNFIGGGVEFFENYIPLCPSCHRMIHLAQDNERRMLLNTIINNNRIIKSKIENCDIPQSNTIIDKIEFLYDMN